MFAVPPVLVIVMLRLPHLSEFIFGDLVLLLSLGHYFPT